MTAHASTVRDLPDEGLFFERLAGRRPAVFLDYDGVLTPIVDRPEDAVISKGMRTTVRALARRCPVCVVSGRDPQTPVHRVQLGGLASAGSHSQPLGSPRCRPDGCWAGSAPENTDCLRGYEQKQASEGDPSADVLTLRAVLHTHSGQFRKRVLPPPIAHRGAGITAPHGGR